MPCVTKSSAMTPLLLSHNALSYKPPMGCHPKFQHRVAVTRPAKTVRFSTVTILEFHVGLSCSVVPSDQAPGVGLTGHPVTRTTSFVIDDTTTDKRVMKYTAHDRILLLKRQGLTPQDVLALCMHQNKIQVSRRICVLEAVQPPHGRFAKYMAKRHDIAEEFAIQQRSAKRPCTIPSTSG